MAEEVSHGYGVDRVRLFRSARGKVEHTATASKKTVSVGDNGKLGFLPDELLLRIFNFLDVRSLLACCSTCKRWVPLASDNSLWKELYCLYFAHKQPSSALCVEAMHWKERFIKQSKKRRDKTFLKSMDGRKSCDFASRVEDHLRKLCNKFQLSLTTRAGKVYNYSEKTRVYGLFAIMIRWHSLDEFPSLKDVRKIEVFSSTPILMSKSGRMLVKGPKQKSLVLCDDQLNQLCVGPHGRASKSDDEISYIGLHSGILVGLWRKSNDVAFVTASLHTYQLLNKCLLSTSETIAACQHVVKHDDISRFYGLQGYEFHIQIVTGDSCNVFYFKINSDIMDMKQDATTVSYSVKNSLRVFAFEEAFLAWSTGLFKGKIPGIVFFTLTVIDFNKDIIFNVSQPAKIEVLNEVSTDFESSEKSALTLTCVDELVGKGKLVLSRHYSCDRFTAETIDEGVYLDAFSMTFNTKFINQWFGSRY